MENLLRENKQFSELEKAISDIFSFILREGGDNEEEEILSILIKINI